MALLPSGTTSNEALHAELKQSFRQTIRLHQSTMVTKMHVFHWGKLLAFTLARFRPTTRQMPPGEVVARALGSDVFAQAAWERLCETRQDRRPLSKAVGTFQVWHRLDVARVRKWLRKKPAGAALCRPKKRTAFTLRRRR